MDLISGFFFGIIKIKYYTEVIFMTDKEHSQLFGAFREWKLWAYQVFREMNKENIEETKINLKKFNNFYDDKWEEYQHDYGLSGELLDLLNAITKIESKIKELEESH